MNFAEQPASQQWSCLKYKGTIIAEVWFKPDNEPWTLTIRIPQQAFQVPGMDQLLTTAALLKSVGIPAEEVESWCYVDGSRAGAMASLEELSQPLVCPPQDVPHLSLRINLKPPLQEAEPLASVEPQATPAQWQYVVTRWNAILGLEATIDTLRQQMESLRSELEAATNKSLSSDEKLNAPNADVAVWNKAKSRTRYASPKAREYIHRATWAMGTPERKKLDEVFKHKQHCELSQTELKKLQDELEILFKDRQILSAHGVTVTQECKSSLGDTQQALKTLQSNAAKNAQKKRVAIRAKGKSI